MFTMTHTIPSHNLIALLCAVLVDAQVVGYLRCSRWLVALFSRMSSACLKRLTFTLTLANGPLYAMAFLPTV